MTVIESASADNAALISVAILTGNNLVLPQRKILSDRLIPQRLKTGLNLTRRSETALLPLYSLVNRMEVFPLVRIRGLQVLDFMRLFWILCQLLTKRWGLKANNSRSNQD
jgi:hypothetical protein